MARKRKQDKRGKEFSGLAGWEVKYLKDSLKYGHLDANTNSTNKQSRRYG